VSRALVLAIAAVVASAQGSVHQTAVVPQARFEVQGTEIHGPGEGAFTPLGMNLLGPRSFFNAQGRTRGLARTLRSDWRVNTVRLNACLPRGCGYSGVVNRHNDDLDAIVRELTRRRIVTIVALHQVKPGGQPSAGELDEIEAWWRTTARRYRSNAWVWFNVLNEPGHGRPAPRWWLSMHQRLIGAIRDEAPDNLVVVDGTNWGQEVPGLDPGADDPTNSAILTWGAELERQFGNLVFSLHVYDGWGIGQDAATRDARLARFVDRVHAKGVPLVLGEVGGGPAPCCSLSALAAQSAFAVAPARGVGILMWHGQEEGQFRLVRSDGPSSPGQIDDPSSPSNLTWQGQLLWDLTHR
jgi:hypothetical protein